MRIASGLLGIVVCGFAVFLPSASSPTSLASPHYERPTNGEPYKDRVIVFVHGIYGDAKDTWTAPNGVYWPKLLLSDNAYNDSDVYVAGYDSPYWGNKTTFEEIVTNLQNRLTSDGVWKHREVIFVCHSMGGLLVRRLLIEYRDEGYAKKVPFIYFYATPETGSEIAKLASKGSADPLLRILFPGGQAPDYLSNLETEWRKAHFGILQYCAYEKQPYGVLGVIVPRESATRNCTEPAVGIEADHVGIVKPSTKADAQYTALLSATLYNPVSQRAATPPSQTTQPLAQEPTVQPIRPTKPAESPRAATSDVKPKPNASHEKSAKKVVPAPEKPPTFSDLFRQDFPTVLKMSDEISLTREKDGAKILIKRQVYMDFDAKTDFVGFYVSSADQFSDETFRTCQALVDVVQPTIEAVKEGKTQAWGGYKGQGSRSTELLFSGRVFIYHEGQLSIPQKASLIELYKARGYDIQFRGLLDYGSDQMSAWYHEHGVPRPPSVTRP